MHMNKQHESHDGKMSFSLAIALVLAHTLAPLCLVVVCAHTRQYVISPVAVVCLLLFVLVFFSVSVSSLILIFGTFQCLRSFFPVYSSYLLGRTRAMKLTYKVGCW